MLDFKRFGKTLLCLVLCLTCLAVANPVSAMSTIFVPDSSIVLPEEDLPQENGDSAKGQLAAYVRYSASSGAMVVGCMADGTVVNVLGTKKNFYKIDCYDMVGYVAKSQIIQNDGGKYIIKADPDSRESTYLPTFSTQQVLQLRSDVAQVSQKYIGVPYVYGGTTPRGFDCSGFVQYVFRKLGIELNRTAANQSANGIVVAREDMQPGDLVIFSNTSDYRFGTHVGIYLGNDKIIHSGTRAGITIADMTTPYFDTHFTCARRVFLTEDNASTVIPSVGSITGSIGAGWRNN